MSAKQAVLVVGAGIIGASIAWHLQRAGQQVVLVAARTGGVATPTSFSWINASWGNARPYFDLRIRSMTEWDRLAGELPGLAYGKTGALCYDLDADDLMSYQREHTSWGYDLNPVDAAAIASMEPALADRPDFALHAPAEGAAEPVACAVRLMTDSIARGAILKSGVKATGLLEKAGRIVGVATDQGEILADHVVLAAGLETVSLAATVGIDVPVTAPPGLIVHSRPHKRLLNGLVIAPELHMRQTQEGRIIAGSDFGGSQPGLDPRETAADLFEKVRSSMVGGQDLVMDHYTIGYRPTPKDGVSIVGKAAEGLYLALTHSGVTLAPALGVFATAEIVTGHDEPLLAPFRLARFA